MIGQKKCKVKGCATAAYCRGMCNRHYKYFNSYGYVKEITVNNYNKIDVIGKVARIHLRNIQGDTTKFALIDSGDVKLARKYVWKVDSGAVVAKRCDQWREVPCDSCPARPRTERIWHGGEACQRRHAGLHEEKPEGCGPGVDAPELEDAEYEHVGAQGRILG